MYVYYQNMYWKVSKNIYVKRNVEYQNITFPHTIKFYDLRDDIIQRYKTKL